MTWCGKRDQRALPSCEYRDEYLFNRASVRAGASLLFAAEVGALAHRRGRRRVGIGWARGPGGDRKDGGDRETSRYNSTARGSRVRAIVLDAHDALERAHCGSPPSISFAEPGRLWMAPAADGGDVR